MLFFKHLKKYYKYKSTLMILILLFLAFNFEKKIYAEEIKESCGFQIIDGLRAEKLLEYENEYNLEEINFSEDHELFPIINFYDSNEELLNLKDLRGKIVILHFFASWCGHCVNEMNDLNEFSKILKKEELDDEIKIISISVDSSISDAKKFFKYYKLNNLELFFDKNSSAFNSLGLRSLPKTFFISKDGKKLGKADGAIEWVKNKNIIKKLKDHCD